MSIYKTRRATILLCSVAVAVLATSAIARPVHHRHRVVQASQVAGQSFTGADRDVRYSANMSQSAVQVAGESEGLGRRYARGSRAGARARAQSHANSAYGGATSNSLVAEARKYIGTNPTGRGSLWCGAFMAVVRAAFRPEFLNRVDEIILFHRLKKSEMGRIVDIQLARLQKLLDDRKIVITLDPSAREWLAEKGWDPAYGARPLKRVIQKSVQDPLAEMILAGKIKDGEKVRISGDKLGLTFNGKVAQAA